MSGRPGRLRKITNVPIVPIMSHLAIVRVGLVVRVVPGRGQFMSGNMLRQTSTMRLSNSWSRANETADSLP